MQTVFKNKKSLFLFLLGCALSLSIYFFSCWRCFYPFGLITTEPNINGHQGSQTYPRVVFDIISKNGTWHNIYGVPVSHGYSTVKIKTIGPLKIISTPGIQPEFCIKIAGIRFPVMQNTHKGALGYYGTWLFSFFSKDKTFIYHFCNILLGGIIIMLTGYLAYYIFGMATGLTSMFLLSSNLLFIFLIMIPNFQDNLFQICLAVIILLIILFNKTHKRSYLLLASFMCGFGFFQKVTIVCVLTPLLLTGLWLYPKFIKTVFTLPRFSSTIKQLGLFFVLALLGMAPLIFYNIVTNATVSTGTKLLSTLLNPGTVIFNLTNWLIQCLRMFGNPLQFFSNLADIKMKVGNYIPGIIILLSFLFPFFNLLSHHPLFNKKPALFLPLYTVGIFIFIATLSYGNFGFAHPAPLVPLVAVMEAILFVFLAQLIKKYLSRRISHPLLFIAPLLFITLFFILFQLQQIETYSRGFKDNPHNPAHIIDSHKELAQYLMEHKLKESFTTNYNLVGILEFLTDEEIRPVHYWAVWQYAQKDEKTKPEFIKKLLLKNRGSYYILKSGYLLDPLNACAEPETSLLFNVARENNITLNPIKEVLSKSGAVLFTIYRLI